MPTDLRDLDAAGLLAASSGAVRDRRLAEVQDLEVLAQWAALHSSDPTRGPGGAHQRRIGNVLRQVGGEGTPPVQDFCLGEVAMARGTGVTAATNALADVLDLQHRLPLTWEVCRAGRAEVYVARRVAKLSRRLPADRVWVVDQAVAAMIATEPGGKVFDVAEAKIIEADPEAHHLRVEEEKQRRFVGYSERDEHGLQMVFARIEAGDVIALQALVERLSDILEPRHPDLSRDEVRALAFGWVARPAEALALLLENLEGAPTADEPDEPELHRAIAFPADLLAQLTAANLALIRPRAVLYVHLHQSALRGAGGPEGVARVEGLGPCDVDQLRDLLRRYDVVVKPVIDLEDRIRTTAYEHPESLKERVHLITGGDYWPFATSTSRRVDSDHPTTYDHDPPDESVEQTGTHNSGPLGRTHHRWKTFAGYAARQSGLGRYVITTPHGLAFLRDHRGTQPIPLEHARMIMSTDPHAGVDIYPSDVRVEIGF